VKALPLITALTKHRWRGIRDKRGRQCVIQCTS
jgi:hypothetical protein